MSTQPSPGTFDRYADEYDATVQAAIGASGESVAYFAALKARLAKVEAPPGTGRVLDFGCGIGNTSRALATEFGSARITGCDPSAASVATAKARASPRIDYVGTDDRRLPFDDATFDLAVAACVFHHIDGDRHAFWAGEIARVLRPRGRFVLFEHNPLNPLTRRVVQNIPFDRDVVLLGRAEAQRLVRDANLRVARSRYYFFFPRWLAALRPAEPWMGWVPLGGQYYVVGQRTER